MVVLQWLAVLIIAPWAAFIVAALFAGLWWKVGGRMALALATAALWGLYGIYESLMYARILCSGECNIRVDLLLIYPLLLLMSVGSLGLFFFVRRSGTQSDRE